MDKKTQAAIATFRADEERIQDNLHALVIVIRNQLVDSWSESHLAQFLESISDDLEISTFGLIRKIEDDE